jgi:hypothetical protein
MYDADVQKYIRTEALIEGMIIMSLSRCNILVSELSSS